MKTIVFTLALFFLSLTSVFSQKGKASAFKNPISCKCSELNVYPYFYPTDEGHPDGLLFLRFDFHHRGRQKCLPEFKGNITITRENGSTVSFPVSNLIKYENTVPRIIFHLSPLGFPSSFRPMVIGEKYKITYRMDYGITACLSTQKSVELTSGEPIF
jgi:hypothetical protein